MRAVLRRRRGRLLISASNVRIERRKSAVRIVAKDPQMLLVMRFPAVGLVNFGCRIVLQQWVGAAMEFRRLLVARGSVPGRSKNEILNRHELERTVGLWLVD